MTERVVQNPTVDFVLTLEEIRRLSGFLSTVPEYVLQNPPVLGLVSWLQKEERGATGQFSVVVKLTVRPWHTLLQASKKGSEATGSSVLENLVRRLNEVELPLLVAESISE